MKVIPSLHPSFIQRGNWAALALLRDDLKRAIAESWHPGVARRPVNYSPFPTKEDADELLRLGTGEPVVLDLETDFNDHHHIYLCGISRGPGRAAAFPWRRPYTSRIRTLLRDPSCVKVAHNAFFDFGILQDLGFEIKGEWRDTMIAHSLTHPDLPHGLQKIAPLAYDGEPWKGSMKEEIELYNCKDVDVTARLHVRLEQLLEEMGLTRLYREIVMPALPILIKANRWGVRVDKKLMHELRHEFEAEAEVARERVWEEVAKIKTRSSAIEIFLAEARSLEAEAEANWVPGKKREMGKLKTKAKKLREKAEQLAKPNLDSPKQMIELLYEDLKLPEQRSEGRLTTNDDALVEIGRRTQNPIVEVLRQYREVRSHMKYVEYEPRVLHPTLQLHGTATSRLSCVDPNLQNTPSRTERGRRIKRIYVPVREGWMLTAVDYSQIEMRIQGELSREPVILEAYERGEDLHKKTAALALSYERGKEVSPEEVTKGERTIFKTAVYLESYGGGWKKLQLALASRGIYLDVKQAKRVLSVLKDSRPVLARWREEVLRKVEEERYLRTPFGRIREFLGPAFGDALNFLPQATAGDVILRAMNRVAREIEKRELPAIMVMQVHDELLVEHDPGVAPEILELMQGVMERPVPEMNGWYCPTEGKQGTSWAFED